MSYNSIMAVSENTSVLIEFIKNNPFLSSKEIHEGTEMGVGYATVKRMLQQLVSEQLIQPIGKGRGTKYAISPCYELIYPIDVNAYFEKDIDDREIIRDFNHSLMPELLFKCAIFTDKELMYLEQLQSVYTENVAQLSAFEFKKEQERLAIDLSWKSSQIEGNTYTLLETEQLLKEKETAKGKTKDEAVMLLNHKDALDFIIENPDYLIPLKLARIEDIHSILMKELGVDRNIRRRRVGISGTNYSPLDNEYQLREALDNMCEVVNNQKNVFAKALLTLVLISYIQAFADGNKRTARIISNAILIQHNHCPISFRTVDSIEYKKAMLIFYEQNNISAFKNIFIQQFEFAVKTYF
jgi:Fic family protein